MTNIAATMLRAGPIISLFRGVEQAGLSFITGGEFDNSAIAAGIAGFGAAFAVATLATATAPLTALVAASVASVAAGHLASAFVDALYDTVVQYGPELSAAARDKFAAAMDSIEQSVTSAINTVEDAYDVAKSWLGDVADSIEGLFTTGIPAFFDGLGDWLAERLLAAAESARNEASPLVFDLGGDGLDITALGAPGSIFWDIDLDGIDELTAWVKSTDGLLALDRNGDGLINDHAELFGDLTTDGFTVLSAFDDNGDSIISDLDSVYDSLRIWQDFNSNGVSESVELLTLEQVGVFSISLAASTSNLTVAGNRVTHVSTFTRTDGTTGTIADVWFQYDNVHTQRRNIDVPPEIDRLPQLRGYGLVGDLHGAMVSDASVRGRVEAMTAASIQTLLSPSFEFDTLVRQLLWDWSGADAASATGRGRYVDGRDVALIEALTDRAFLQRNNPNPAVEAGLTLTNAVEGTTNAYLFRLFAQLHPESFITGIQFYQEFTDTVVGTLAIDFTKLNAIVAGWNASGAALANGWATLVRIIDGAFGLEDLAAPVRAQLETAITNSDPARALTLAAVMDEIYPDRGLGLNGTSGADTLNGGTGNDTIDAGSGNDILNGRAGHDSLLGGAGDDTLNGETGDDTLQGGAGNDIYIYSSGLDTIREASGTDTLRFGAGVTQSQLLIKVSDTNRDDAMVYIDGVLSVIIEDMFVAGRAIESFRFADGSTLNTAALTAPRNGTTGNDVLTGADLAYFPTDFLVGGRGVDRLSGGLGDDRLLGGDDSDVYVVTSGHDRILDDSGAADRIEFGAGYTLAAAVLTRQGDDLLIAFGGNPAVTIVDQFVSRSAIESIVFQNGQTIDLLVQRYTLEGTAARDTLYGIASGGGGDIVRGLGGDDRIFGYAGNDELDGGDGNDQLDGGDGNDILRGAAGNDSLAGGLGDDSYIYLSGIDTISDRGGADSIQFGTGVTQARVTMRVSAANPANAELLVDGAVAIVVENMFVAGRGIEALRFADNSVIDIGALIVPRNGTTGADVLTGADAAFFRTDFLFGGNGSDRLNGLLGDDWLYGGADSDLYVITSGHDRIADSSGTADRIEFAAGFARTGAVLTRSGDDLTISFNGAAAVTISDQFDGSGTIESLAFANGETINLLTWRYTLEGTAARDTLYGVDTGAGGDFLRGLGGDDRLYGYGGDDDLDGGADNDTLYGGLGSDRYIRSAGVDTVSDNGGAADTVVMGDVTAGRLSLVRSGDNLRIFVDSILSVVIANQFSASGQIETLTLASGTVLDLLARAYPVTGTAANDRIDGISFGGNPDDVLRGLDGNDDLFGYAGDDLLDGGAGDDELYGSIGNDSYDVGAGNNYVYDDGLIGDADRILLPSGVQRSQVIFLRDGADNLVVRWATGSVRIGNAYDAADTVELLVFSDGMQLRLVDQFAETVGSAGNDRLEGNEEELGSRDDVMSGLAGNDILRGYSGNDRLDGGAGSDVMRGGTGNDIYVVDVVTDDIRELANEGTDLLISSLASTTLPDHFENLTLTGAAAAGTGNALDNLIVGAAGNDILSGLGGNDTLDGGAGADQLTGGIGNDSYIIDNAGDLVFESAGQGTDSVSASVSHYLYANVENLVLTGSTNIFGVGNDLANTLTGNAGENLLIAGAGVDSVRGGGARDAIFGEGGDDALFGDAGVDYIVAGIGNDSVDGGVDADEIYGEAGDDVLNGGASFHTDIIVGGDGNDTIRGDSGFGDFDFLYGNLGNDIFHVDTPADLVFEQAGEGTDTVFADINGAGFYLYDNIENLTLLGSTPFGVGNALGNNITGNAQGNYLLGGAGNDVLNGLGGGDVLFGEGGADTFVFGRGTGGDVIGDFERGIDKIDLRAFGFSSFAQLQSAFVQNGNVGAINLGNGDLVVLHNVTMSQLVAADFML